MTLPLSLLPEASQATAVKTVMVLSQVIGFACAIGASWWVWPKK